MLNKLFSMIGYSIAPSGRGLANAVSLVNSSPSFPEEGTILSTEYGVEFPVAEGGQFVYYQDTNYPNETVDVNIVADGSGGSYYDWTNTTNKQYKTSVFTTYTSNTEDIIIDGVNWGAGCTYYGDVYHDGNGWYYEVGTSGGCTSYNTHITDGGSGSNEISTPIGMWAYQTWTDVNYYHDGSGGYYADYNYDFTASVDEPIGTDYTSGSNSREVPDFSGVYYSYEIWDSVNLFYDGYGSYYSTYNYTYVASWGDEITNDGTYTYFWDGTGYYFYY
jgi:hypothetical protein